MSIINEVKAHEKEILSGEVPAGIKNCLRCKKKPHIFHLQEYRERIFLFIADGFVQKIESFLSRWKCSLCHLSFTYYPEFAIPCKRYVKADIFELSEQYVADDQSTYRKLVQDHGSSIGYESQEDKIDERSLSRSTVWRWLSFIGLLQIPLSNTFKLVRQKYPASDVFQQPTAVQRRKYRSCNRKKILQRTIRFFDIKLQHPDLFKITISPTLLQRTA